MKTFPIIAGCALIANAPLAFAQEKKEASGPSQQSAEQEIIDLSKKKWDWMAERNVEALAALFNEKSVFVHMSGLSDKEQELNVIKSGSIQYKKAEVQETTVKFIGDTAILFSKIRLLAVVRGNEVTNPFVVTEVFVKQGGTWTLGSLSFSRTLGQ